MGLASLFFAGVLIDNFVFSRFLGLCPFLGVSRRLEAAIGMGMAVTFVMTVSSGTAWVAEHYFLAPFGLTYLRTIAYIIIIASLVQGAEMVLGWVSPVLQASLGTYLPLITTNCAVLGVALLNAQAGYGFWQSVVHGVAGAVGFGLALFLFAGVRERLELADVPPALAGMPVVFLAAGLASLAFLGFQGWAVH